MKISKKDALMWFEFFAALPEEEELMPHQQEIALAALAQIETAVNKRREAMASRIDGLQSLSASISCTRKSYGWFNLGFTGSTAKQSPEISQFRNTNCCNS